MVTAEIDDGDLFFAQRVELERAQLVEGNNIDESRCWLVVYILRKCSPASRNITRLPKVAVHSARTMHVYRYISHALTAIYLYIKVFTIYAWKIYLCIVCTRSAKQCQQNTRQRFPTRFLSVPLNRLFATCNICIFTIETIIILYIIVHTDNPRLIELVNEKNHKDIFNRFYSLPFKKY